jgi:KaiC/GvpD/RAD55 family RecA-like ATPase
MNQVKTGIAGLDEFLQGGFPSRVFLLQGQPGSGNEVFARQVAYYRAAHNQVSYCLQAKSAQSIKEDMAAYRFDISSLEQSGTWRFVILNDKRSFITSITREMQQNRCVVIDSLSDLLLTHSINDMIKLLHTMSTHTRETTEPHFLLVTQGMHDLKVETILQHYADGAVLFNTNWNSETATRSLIIQKMTGSVIPPRSLLYSLGPRGFIVETATRIT